MPIFGEMALGVASSFVHELLKKPLSTITAEMSRRDLIGKSINERQVIRHIDNEERKAEIFGDLAKVIGNSEGKLSDEVALYLRELQRTAIPDAVAQIVLCGSSIEDLVPALELFHERFSGLDYKPVQFLNALYQATKLRLEDVGDKAMLDIIRAQHSEILTRLNHLVGAMTRQAETILNLSNNELKDCRNKISRMVESQNKLTTVETLQGNRKFNLKSLSIPARVVRLDQSDIQSAKVPSETQSITYGSFRKTFDKAVLLGDPGGGKSTLTQLLSLDLANWVILEAGNPARREFEPRDLKIPLRVVLRSFEVRQLRSPSYSLYEYIRDELKVALDHDISLSHRFLSHLLKVGEAIVIFDGLDEVLDVGSRQSLVNQIEQFSELYAACPVLVTSRLVGYRDAPLADDFVPYGLSRFNLDEIRKYSEKAIKAVNRVNVAEAKVKAQEFIEQTNRVGGDIRENPLMLGLMVQIFVFRGDVPSNRPEVYKECAMLMFEKWDGRRNIKPNLPRDELELLDVFGYVASKTFGNVDYEEGVSKSWLQQELRNHFEDWYIDKASANRAAKSLVEFLTGRAWVMSEVGPETFKFTHRTFLEYFFARNMISESRSIEELFQIKLLPGIIKNERIVIGHLALHMAIFRDGGKSRQASEAIHNKLTSVKLPSREEFPFLEFIAYSLDYISISQSIYIEIVRLIVHRAMNLGSYENYNAVNIVAIVLKTAKTRRAIAIGAVNEIVNKALSDEKSAEFLFALYMLGYRQPNLASSLETLSNLEAGESLYGVLSQIRDKQALYIKAVALSNVEAARIYIYTYRDSRVDLFKKHGKMLVGSSLGNLFPANIDLTLASALSYVAFMILRRRSERILTTDGNLKDSLEFIKIVSDDIVDSGFQYHQVLQVTSRHTGHLGNILDEVFHNMWSVCRNGRVPAYLVDPIATMLLCAITLGEAFIISAAQSKKQPRSGAVFIPDGPLRIIVESLSSSRHYEMLVSKIEEKPLTREKAGGNNLE